jgi:hypothetical protein
MTVLGKIFRGVVNVAKTFITGQTPAGQVAPVALQQNTPTQAVTFKMEWVFMAVGGIILAILIFFGLSSRKR